MVRCPTPGRRLITDNAVRSARGGVSRDPDADALICAEFTWSWRTLDRVTRRLAQSYLELGLRPGDRIASLMPNRPRLIAHYIACFRAGLVATPLNYRYTATEIDHALDVSGARALLVHAEREPDLDESRRRGSLPLGRIGYPRPSRDGVSFDDLIDGEPTAPAPPRPDPSIPQSSSSRPAAPALPRVSPTPIRRSAGCSRSRPRAWS